jgi:dynein heavy chain
MLEHFLPEGYMSQEEEDSRSVIRLKWQKLVDFAEDKTDELSEQQVEFRRRLLTNIGEFKLDVKQFRKKFKSHGPMIEGLDPTEAVSRMKRFKEEFQIRDRKLELYCGGEELFALPQTQYPDMDATRKELTLLDRLYGLYMDAIKVLTILTILPIFTVLTILTLHGCHQGGGGVEVYLLGAGGAADRVDD